VPTTTGAPDNGFEGMRFLGYPIFEGLVLWDLSRAMSSTVKGFVPVQSWFVDLTVISLE
jgi:hypothetical protein